MHERLVKINECLLDFGVDAGQNIKSVLELCLFEFNATAVLFNSINKGKYFSISNLGTQFENEDLPGLWDQICSDFEKEEKSFVQIIRNLRKTKYAVNNPTFNQYNLKTLIGSPIFWEETIIGSLCIVFQEDKILADDEKQFLSSISTAVAIEEERRSSQEVIQNSLQEKEILLKELFHRVKNNLQVISSLLYLQSIEIEDEKILSLFQDSTSRVRSMSLVYEKLFQSTDFTNLNFADYVNNLVSYLIDTFSTKIKITKKLEIDDILLPIDTVIPCGLIINELVTNSIKYAFPVDFTKTPEIRISIKLNENKFVLTVADNGIGLSDDISFETEQKTLGLKLINMLTSQLYGEIKLDRNNGTEFQITFG
ncbi:MAG: ATP-binding protein [Ignavibacteriales bacterium]|nr:ATP-binding protein [Ignavibacteriales bacterium]